MPKSTLGGTRRKAEKPSKPRADFPLFVHATGRWAKKVRGSFAYFGKASDDPKGEAALDLWLFQRDDLLAGRKPRKPGEPEGLTVLAVSDKFMAFKDALVTTGELRKRSWNEYHAVCETIIAQFGRNRLASDIAGDDFAALRAHFAKTAGPVRLGKLIQISRMVFKYGFDSGAMDRPVRFGAEFKRPSKKTLRIERAKKGARIFEAAELRLLIQSAGIPLRAMLLLGINCGFGNADCANLEFAHVDLLGGWITFPRPKTGVQRRCKLWPETVAALETAIGARPTPKDDAHKQLIFVTKYGQAWHKGASTDNPISKEMRKLLDELELHRPGLGFYALRHGFETIGGESRDQVAVDHVMGHARDDMASAYRERVSDDRLVAVAEFVRKWLYPPEEKKVTKKGKKG